MRIGRPRRSSRREYVNPRSANFEVTYAAPPSYAWRPCDRAHVDDVPPVAEVRQAEPSHPDETGDVDGEDGRFVLLARLVERHAAERETCIVDEDVEAAEMLDGLRDEPLAARGGR